MSVSRVASMPSAWPPFSWSTLGRNTSLHLTVICLAGLALRLGFLTRVPVFLLNDSGGYHLPAWDLVNGLGFDLNPRRTPGYPLFLAGIIELAGQDLLAIAFVQHLLGLGAALMVYLIARRLFGAITGLAAGLVVVLEGTLLISEHYVMPETLFTVSVLLALWLLLHLRDEPFGAVAMAAGFVLGVAVLVRPVGLVLAPLALLVALARPGSVRQRAAGALLLLCGLGIVVAPWVVRNWVVQGTPSISSGLSKSLLARTAKHDRGFRFYEPALAESYGDRREAQARQIIQSGINQRLSDGEIHDRLGERLRLTDTEVDRLLRDLIGRVIAERPIYFAQRSAEFTWELLHGEPERLRSDWKTQNARLTRDDWEDRVQHLLRKPTELQEQGFWVSEALVDLVQPSRLGAILPLLGLLGAAYATVRHGLNGALPALAALVLVTAPATLDGPVPRYRYPADPLVTLLAVGGVVGLIAFVPLIQRRWSQPRATRQPAAGSQRVA